MLLILYAVLALIPLLGIAWILIQGSGTTVDGLFMSLILATISAIFGVSALFEFRESGLNLGRSASPARRMSSAISVDGLRFDRGIVHSVLFYESNIGEPNKSIVTLMDGGSRLLVIEGDARNALPVGKNVEIVSRGEAGHRVLVDVNYA